MENFWHILILAWIVGVGIYGLIWWNSYLEITKNDYRDLIELELAEFNLNFISSRFFRPKFSDKPIKAPEMKHSIAYGGGGLGMVVTHGHRSPRKVQFRDDSGDIHEAIALIELKGVISKQFQKIHWDPPLKVFAKSESI